MGLQASRDLVKTLANATAHGIQLQIELRTCAFQYTCLAVPSADQGAGDSHLRFQASTAVILAILAAVPFQRVDRVQSFTDATPKLLCHLEVAAAPHHGST
jgi:hypothetical protein